MNLIKVLFFSLNYETTFNIYYYAYPTSKTFDRLNKYFTINQMTVISSQYWNSVHGNTSEEVEQDIEGLQIMRTLCNNMAWMLKIMNNSYYVITREKESIATNFIR